MYGVRNGVSVWCKIRYKRMVRVCGVHRFLTNLRSHIHEYMV